jgi:hypothetical protein
MEKLFRFSKIASIVVLLIAIFRIISSGIVLMFEPIFEYYRTIEIVNDILFILFNTLILIFFLLIYKNSTNGSVLRIPTLIGMISSAVAMICRLFLTFTYYGGFLDILNMICVIGLCISFIWIAKYMKNPVKIFSWLCAIIPVIAFLFSQFFFTVLLPYASDLFEKYLITYHYSVIIINVFKYLLFSVFYYTFSKTLTK